MVVSNKLTDNSHNCYYKSFKNNRPLGWRPSHPCACGTPLNATPQVADSLFVDMIYPLATHKYKNRQTPGLSRMPHIIGYGAPGVSTFVLKVRTLCHQLRMPHFLELLVKVALSIACDYPFQKGTCGNTGRATRWYKFA